MACPLKTDPRHYRLVGITAWGIGCGQENIPGVYANVLYDRSWIMQQISDLFPKTTLPPTTESSYLEVCLTI